MSLDVGHHPAVEEYLETVYHLEESRVPAMRARLVERLQVSAPAVSEQVRRLEREGYLVLGPDRTLQLTDRGRSYATTIVRRHRLAERLLVDILGLPWHQVHAEAGRLEHAISAALEARLAAVLGDPGTCPHGNPIPGSSHHSDPGPMVSVTALAPGVAARVIRIEEDLQADLDTMLRLETAGALPGAQVCIRPDQQRGAVLLIGPQGEVRLDRRAAAAVLVAAPPG